MVSKYKGLPDVDYGAQEVFENSDVEEERHVPESPRSDPNIIQESLHRSEAEIRFGNDVVVGEAVDFLGNVSLGKFIGYNVARVDETRQQKLARIEQELSQLSLEEDDVQVKSLISMLDTIQNGKKEADRSEQNLYGTKVKSLFDLITNELHKSRVGSRDTNNNNNYNNDNNLVDTGVILELETKINSLETQIGPEFFTEAFPTSIHAVIKELTRKTHIIQNPEYAIDIVKEKIDSIKKENDILETQTKVLNVIQGNNNILKRLAGLGSDAGLSETERTQLRQLCSRIPEFDAVNHTVPRIIERLKTLQRVHIDTTCCVNFVGELDLVVNSIMADMVKWDTSINKCMENLEAYEANFNTNKESILKQMDELEKALHM